MRINRAQEQHKQVQALAIVLHDLLNDLGVASAIEPAHASERRLLFDLWSATEEGDVLVLGSVKE